MSRHRRKGARRSGRGGTRPRGATPAARRAITAPAPTPERPRAPWHPVPLVELCVLAGIVLIVVGLVRRDSDGGRALLVAGLALGSLGGLETAVREHWAGYRSHTLVLAGFPAVVVAGILFFARVPWLLVPASAALVFAAALVALRRVYAGRS